MTTAKNITYERVRETALQLFGYDKDKLNNWWLAPCNEFDGLSPYEVVKKGKGQRLMRYLERCAL